MKKIIFLLGLLPVLAFSQSQDQNYIKTKTYKEPTTTSISNPNLDAAQVQVGYFDGLGRPIQTIGVGQGANRVNTNLLDWRNTWTVGSGSVLPFNLYGSVAENVRSNGVGPFGKTTILWQCGNDAVSDADGGWDSNYMAVDKNSSYRYAVWVKRTGSQDGMTYHGVRNVVNLDGSTNTNPYFWNGDLPQLNTWYLMVGMIHPASYAGAYSGISGVYDTAGNKVLSGTDFKWTTATVTASFRSYFDSATDVNTIQFFYNPTLQKIDGTEASLAGLCADSDASDIVTHIDYDGFGRSEKEYLPYAVRGAVNGNLKPNALVATLGFYNSPTPSATGNLSFEATSNPYSQKLFEVSPFNSVLKQSAPGNDWLLNPTGADHSIKMDQQTNGVNEVKLFTVATSWNTALGIYDVTLTQTNMYPANELYKTITQDENWVAADINNKTTQEFKDKEGHVILKRTFDAGIAHDTYYVYDSYGNLTYVLPPKSEGAIDFATLSTLCYQYKYDYRNRLVEKKLPGKEWEYIIYDKLDRPVLTQDANLRTESKWLFVKYDAFNRPVYTGEYANTTEITRVAVQNLAGTFSTLSEVKQGPTIVGDVTANYSNNAFPNVKITLFTINYYDDYNFDLNGGVTETAYGITPMTTVKSLATGSKVRVLGTSDWITTVPYYDDKARLVYTYSKNDFLATTDKVKSKLDFSGKTLETITTHTRVVATVPTTTSIVDLYMYDHAGRVLSQKQKINSQAEQIIAVNNYDDLGQLTSKGIGGKINQNRLQQVDFKYNIRGWLKSINDVNTIGNDLFAFQINYNAPTAGGTPLYNGNISQTHWKTASVDGTLKNYNYTYDALNRLVGSSFRNTSTTIYNTSYIENLRYDKNGNIDFLYRTGDVPSDPNLEWMDYMTYFYNGNQLTRVMEQGHNYFGFTTPLLSTDTSTQYQYDANGNMSTDRNKGITGITYNHLNLPTQIILPGGTINYVYDATGKKLQKKVTQTSPASSMTTDYAGGYIYENNIMQFFSQPEGYVTRSLAKGLPIFSYTYQYKDHLGNVRLSYSDGNNDGLVNTYEIIEENNYYPFGLKHKGYNNVVTSTNSGLKYKYNGKEYQDELGLNMYDYGAMLYDPATGRRNNIDPLAEVNRRISPFSYAKNNPMRYVDPDGMLAQDVINDMWNKSGDGETKWTNNNGTFSNGNGDTVDAGEEETPPDDITVGSNGKVTNKVVNGKPNRFFDEKGKQMKPNDASNDNQYLDGNYNVGDQVFTPISISKIFSFLLKAGIMPPSGLGLASRYGATALQSHSAADFGFNQLMSAYNETYKNTEYAGGAGNGTFYRFANQNTLYNLGDAGNFLWGAWMSFNNFSSTEVKIGSQVNSVFTLNGFDTAADQRAINNGFNLLKK